MSDLDDLDYDDPRLLAALSAPSTSSADLSYADRRKRTLAQQQDRGRNAPKTGKQEEVEARERGLGTNLIEQEVERSKDGGEESRAMRMMRAMGFTPGDALGPKQAASSSSSSATPPTAPTPSSSAPRTGGIGFARASFAPAAGLGSGSGSATSEPAAVKEEKEDGGREKGRTEPIRFEMRAARTGLGVPQAKRPRTTASSLPGLDTSTTPLPDLEGYLTHLKSTMDAKRAWGLLRSARRTCEELDRRAGIEDSPMWRDPEEEARETETRERRRLFDRVDKELDSDDERKVGEREKKAAEAAAKRKEGRGGLAYETGLSATVVDDEDDDDEADEGENEAGGQGGDGDGLAAAHTVDEDDWFSTDVQTRLGLTLAYLRTKYHYCLWCGCAYDDATDLEANCPGTEEEQH
ncbi:hypothetical protein JCM8097_003183 [Rhodosporidiobolus ruineniae]